MRHYKRISFLFLFYWKTWFVLNKRAFVWLDWARAWACLANTNLHTHTRIHCQMYHHLHWDTVSKCFCFKVAFLRVRGNEATKYYLDCIEFLEWVQNKNYCHVSQWHVAIFEIGTTSSLYPSCASLTILIPKNRTIQ